MKSGANEAFSRVLIDRALEFISSADMPQGTRRSLSATKKSSKFKPVAKITATTARLGSCGCDGGAMTILPFEKSGQKNRTGVFREGRVLRPGRPHSSSIYDIPPFHLVFATQIFRQLFSMLTASPILSDFSGSATVSVASVGVPPTDFFPLFNSPFREQIKHFANDSGKPSANPSGEHTSRFRIGMFQSAPPWPP